MSRKYIIYILIGTLGLNLILILLNFYFDLIIRINLLISLLSILLITGIFLKYNEKNKSLIFLMVLSIINILSYSIYINNLKSDLAYPNIETPVEIIDCKLNGKNYSYDIIYSLEDKKYIIKNNDSLKIDVAYNSEEELKNLITTIFENKGATCNVKTNYQIDIDLAYEE